MTSHSMPLPGLPSPIPISPGYEHSNWPISRPSWYKGAARTWCHSNSWHGETLQEDLLSFQEASFCTDPRYRQIEAGEPTFINPAVQEMLELQISKRVKLKLWEGKGKESSDRALSSVADMLQSWSREQAITCKPEPLSGHQQLLFQKVLGNNLRQDCRQFFWGLPLLHSESLMTTVSMAGSPLDPPSMLFNGLSTYNLIQVERNGTPQLFSPTPLLQHLVESQPLTANLSWPSSPPVSGIKTQAYDPPSIPSLPPYPPPSRDHGASCPTASRSQPIVPLAVQHLEKYLLKKYQESRTDLPDMVKKSQEIFNQFTSDSLASQGQGSVPHLLEEFTNAEPKEQLEEHFKNSCGKHEDHKIQPSPDPIKSEDKLPGMGHAEDNQETSCSPALADKSSQHPQRGSSKGPEIVQTGKDPCRDLINCLGGSLSEPDRIAEGSLEKVLEVISETEVENCCVRQPRSDSPSPQLEGPGEEQLQGLLRNHVSSEWGCYNDSTVPVGTCPGISVDHAVVLPENSETHVEYSETHVENSETHMENSETNFKSPETNMETQKQTFLSDGPTFKDTSRLSFLDPGAQQVLETHLTRRLVRHRWALPLKGLKTVQRFNVNKPVALPLPQSPTPSWVGWDSSDNSIVKTVSILREFFQKGPEEALRTKTASRTQTPPSALAPPNDSLRPSEAPSTVQRDNVTSLCTTPSLVGRDWHSDIVLGTRNDNPEPGSNLVKSGCKAQKSKGMAIDLSHGLSVQEIMVASQSATNRGTRELEEEWSCDWALNAETRELANSQTNNGHLKDVESLQTSQRQSPSRTISQDPEESAAGVILQDCTTGMFFHDCSPEVLLATDILAAWVSQTSCRTGTTTSNTSSKEMYPFLSRGRNVPKNPKSEKPWTNHVFSPTDKKKCRASKKDIYLSEMTPAQAYRSDTHEGNSSPLTEKTFGDSIKNFMKNFMSVVTTKSQVHENSLQKVKAASATPQSQGSIMNRVFTGPQVAEAQALMPSVRPNLQEKVGVGPASTASRKRLHKEPSQAPMGRHVCLHGSAITERNKAHGNNLRVYSQPSTDKWMDYHSQAQLSRKAMTRANACQHRVQPPHVASAPFHCPRHCLCRSELSRKAKPFPHLP